MMRSFIETAVADGDLTLDGKGPVEFWEDVLNLIRSRDLVLATDHTGHLRDLGREFRHRGEDWLACVFMATWVEHILNNLVSLGIHRMRLGQAITRQVIREVPLAGKLSWLMPLLGFRPLPPPICKTLRELTDKRNAFVHYKWAYHRGNESTVEDEQLAQLLDRSEKALRYLAAYSTRMHLKGTKGAIAKVMRGGR